MKKLIIILICLSILGCVSRSQYMATNVVERMEYVYDPSVDVCYGVSLVEGNFGIVVVPIPCNKIPSGLLIVKDKSDLDRIEKELRRKLLP